MALVSPAMFLEYEDVLKREEQRTAHDLSPSEESFLAAFAAASEAVDIAFRWRPQLLDPGDEMVLEAAVNGRAEALVTHNVRHFRPAAIFGLRVLRPGELLSEIG